MLRFQRERPEDQEIQGTLWKVDSLRAHVLPFCFYMGRIHDPLSKRKGRPPVSLPRENVLLVPFRNVLLTGSGWGGGRHRSSPYDAAGSRPAGGTETSALTADHPKTGRRADAVHRTAREAITPEAEERGRQGGDSRAAWARLQPQAQPKGSRQDRADSLAGDLPADNV